VISEFENPFHMEILSDCTHVVESTNSGCGDEARIYIVCKSNVIENIGFQAFGCASCLAATSFLCRTVFGKDIKEVAEITREVFEDAFRDLEPAQRHCIDMAEALIKKIVELKIGADAQI
jgi:nitrogen fixation NifU-like protein